MGAFKSRLLQVWISSSSTGDAWRKAAFFFLYRQTRKSASEAKSKPTDPRTTERTMTRVRCGLDALLAGFGSLTTIPGGMGAGREGSGAGIGMSVDLVVAAGVDSIGVSEGVFVTRGTVGRTEVVGDGNTALILVGRIVNNGGFGLNRIGLSDTIGEVDGGGASVDEVVEGGSTDVVVVVVELDGGGGASVVL